MNVQVHEIISVVFLYFFRASAEGRRKEECWITTVEWKRAQISSRLMNGVVLKLMLNPVIFCAVFNTIVGVAIRHDSSKVDWRIWIKFKGEKKSHLEATFARLLSTDPADFLFRDWYVHKYSSLFVFKREKGSFGGERKNLRMKLHFKYCRGEVHEY